MSKTSAFVDFKAVKAAITMEQVLEHYGVLDTFKGLGTQLSGPCPIHKGTNPSQFRVETEKNIWNCFSECKHGGNVLDFIVEMENVSIHKAALKAIEWFNLDPEAMKAESSQEHRAPRESARSRNGSSGKDENRRSESSRSRNGSAAKPFVRKETPKEEDNTPNEPLKFSLDKLQRSHPYFEERGIKQETVIDFGLGYCDKGLMAGRIAIPIHNVKGEVLGYAGRWPGEPPKDTPKYKLPPKFKKSLELFNLDQAIKERTDMPLVIVEGFFDCMRLHQHGYRRVVALMGSTMSEAQEELIKKQTDSESHVIVMLDEDDAGIAGREDIACRLSKFCFVRVHQFEKAGMQPEDFSAEEVDSLLNR